MSRILPHPVLTLVIAGVWLLLVNAFSLGALLMGLIIGVLVPLFTGPYWPGRPRVRHPVKIAAYMAIVLWDIVVSNVQVAYLVLFRRGESLRSRFVTVPLELETPEAISVLAGTITMTPGTVSADLSACGRSLLVHCLETDDPEGTVAQIKQRYERRLKEIFE
ncbi:Na+/H+ antiporter subunit E [Salinarimonas sp. NSM]|uniref:Na+/H+ antiporter subunit E n=1 Tax=Salinarimonas sp. NSM TaxID=3458003 RepID=UPI0040375EA4